MTVLKVNTEENLRKVSIGVTGKGNELTVTLMKHLQALRRSERLSVTDGNAASLPSRIVLDCRCALHNGESFADFFSGLNPFLQHFV